MELLCVQKDWQVKNTIYRNTRQPYDWSRSELISYNSDVLKFSVIELQERIQTSFKLHFKGYKVYEMSHKPFRCLISRDLLVYFSLKLVDLNWEPLRDLTKPVYSINCRIWSIVQQHFIRLCKAVLSLILIALFQTHHCDMLAAVRIKWLISYCGKMRNEKLDFCLQVIT